MGSPRSRGEFARALFSTEDSVGVIAAYNADQRESRGRSPADELILKAMNQNEFDMTVQRVRPGGDPVVAFL